MVKKKSRARVTVGNAQTLLLEEPKLLSLEERVEKAHQIYDREIRREADEQNTNAQRIYRYKRHKDSREIEPLPIETINWERRLSTKYDFKLFCEIYGETVFYLGWSDDQLKCVEKIEIVGQEAGVKLAFAMPRGGGKTALCRMAILWMTLHGHQSYIVYIGSREDSAHQSLKAAKTNLYSNTLLGKDFPEICYPIVKIENRFHMARGQIYNGLQTHIDWSTDQVRYPCLQLPDEIAQVYKDHDKDSVVWVPDKQLHIPKSGWVMIDCAGIDGSIRGKAETHPVTLQQPRPGLVLLDDIQKDQKAESPASCEKMILLIDGAIEGLSGPDEALSGLMPCTVIRQGDVSDTYLSPDKKPDWAGERSSMVNSWPEGVNDYDITKDTPEGEHWNKYAELRRKSLGMYGDIRSATSYYKEYRKIMDKGFTCSWDERFQKKGRNAEVSAQQCAMNTRLKNPITFPSEYQNIGRIDEKASIHMVTAEVFAEKQLSIHEYSLQSDNQHLVAFIDVQDEILFLVVLGASQNYNCIVPHYCTYPIANAPFFTKNQTIGWNMLSREYFRVHLTEKEKAPRIQKGKPKAPLDQKIYFAVQQAHKYLRNLTFIRQDGYNTEVKIGSIAVDARWGEASDAVKRAVRDTADQRFHVYMGRSIPPTNKQLEEYTRSGQYSSWLFEDTKHPRIQNPKWLYKPGTDGKYYFDVDVDRMKDFLFKRLSSAPGSPGSISLYEAPAEKHHLFCHHVCSSEYPELVIARGMEKNKWMVRQGRPDNDWLDGLVGCNVLLSYSGAFCPLEDQEKPPTLVKRKLSEMHSRKR